VPFCDAQASEKFCSPGEVLLPKESRNETFPVNFTCDTPSNPIKIYNATIQKHYVCHCVAGSNTLVRGSPLVVVSRFTTESYSATSLSPAKTSAGFPTQASSFNPEAMNDSPVNEAIFEA
jgi:hypothetical protein